jgi:hypothetical protein
LGKLDVLRAPGLDIYGTLVDPLDIDEHLRGLIGEKAVRGR